MLPNRVEKVVQRTGQLLFHLHVADLPGAVPYLQIRHFFHIRVKRVVVYEHRISINLAGDIGSHPVGIGEHSTHLFLNGLCVVRQKNRIVQALAHFGLAIGTYKNGDVTDQGVRNRENLPVVAVEPPGDLPGYLHVRQVISSHGNQVRPWRHNIRRLQNRVSDKPERDRLVVQPGGAGHILDAGQARDSWQGHQHLEKEIHLVHRMHRRLQVYGGSGRIDAHCQVVQQHLPYVLPQGMDVFLLRPGREHVQVRHQKEAFVFILQPNPVFQRADVMSKVHPPGGPVSRQDPFPFVHCDSLQNKNPRRGPAGTLIF